MSSATPPRISVIVPCRNEAPNLAACLQSLVDQELPPDEILVIDDGSIDESRQRVREFARTTALPIRLRAGAQRGAAAARNVGAAQAAGDLLIFVEADARYPRSYLAHAAQALCAPHVGGAIGGRRCVWADRDTLVARAWNHLFHGRWQQQCLGRRAPLGAWVFRRSDFERLGGYDETLIVGEDRDLALRVGAQGQRIAFFPGGKIHHRDPPSLAGSWRRAYWGGRHSLPFRRRWGHPRRDLALALALLILPIAALIAILAVPGAWPLPAAVALGLPLLPTDVRWAMRRGLHSKDPAGTLVVPLLFAITKLAAAAGIVVAWIRETRCGRAGRSAS